MVGLQNIIRVISKKNFLKYNEISWMYFVTPLKAFPDASWTLKKTQIESQSKHNQAKFVETGCVSGQPLTGLTRINYYEYNNQAVVISAAASTENTAVPLPVCSLAGLSTIDTYACMFQCWNTV